MPESEWDEKALGVGPQLTLESFDAKWVLDRLDIDYTGGVGNVNKGDKEVGASSFFLDRGCKKSKKENQNEPCSIKYFWF